MPPKRCKRLSSWSTKSSLKPELRRITPLFTHFLSRKLERVRNSTRVRRVVSGAMNECRPEILYIWELKLFENKTNRDMRVTIDAVNIQEVEKILLLLKSLNINNIEVIPEPSGQRPSITKGDKRIDPTGLFGIWKDNPRNIQEIRASNWKRNWNA